MDRELFEGPQVKAAEAMTAVLDDIKAVGQIFEKYGIEESSFSPGKPLGWQAIPMNVETIDKISYEDSLGRVMHALENSGLSPTAKKYMDFSMREMWFGSGASGSSY